MVPKHDAVTTNIVLAVLALLVALAVLGLPETRDRPYYKHAAHLGLSET